MKRKGLLCVSLPLVLGCSLTASAVADDGPTLSAIRNAYEANRASFAHGKVRSRWSVGTAAGIGPLLDGQWKSRVVTECVYTFDGGRAVCERIYPLKTMVEDRRKAGARWISSVLSVRVLTDGKRTLIDHLNASDDGREILHTASLEDSTDSFYSSFTSPLNLGNPRDSNFSIGSDIKRSLSPPRDVQMSVSEEEATVDGRKVVHLVGTFGDAKRDYWVDLERGAIPLRILDTDAKNEPGWEMRYGDVRPAGNGAWFPYRMSLYLPPGLSKDLVVDSADFEARPAAKDFRLEFPKAMPLDDPVKGIRYEPRAVWDVANLSGSSPVPSRRMSIQEPGPPAPAMPGEREAGPAWALPLTFGGLLLAGAGVFAYVRRRRAGAI